MWYYINMNLMNLPHEILNVIYDLHLSMFTNAQGLVEVVSENRQFWWSEDEGENAFWLELEAYEESFLKESACNQ